MPTRILVVDDSPTIRTVVSTILERHGYDPKVASDGQDAFDALTSGEVEADLILVDLVMPQMDGYAFCQALRGSPQLEKTPVVLMSAKADRIRDQFVEQTGALDAITKPFDARALVAVVENALRRVHASERGSSKRLEVADETQDRSTRAVSDFDMDPTGTFVPLGPEAAELELRRFEATRNAGAKLASVVARSMAEPLSAAEASGPLGPMSQQQTTVLAERLGAAMTEIAEAVVELQKNDPPKAGSGPILAGDLGIVPIGAVLQLLQAENQTGVLVCTTGHAEVRATFRRGNIDLVEASGAGDAFRLGRYFVDEGLLTQHEVEAVVRTLAPFASTFDGEARTSAPLAAPQAAAVPLSDDDLHGMDTVVGKDLVEALAAGPGTSAEAGTPERKPLGLALVAAGKITDAQLRAALSRQSSELLYEVLRWPAGRFELRHDAPSELAASARLALPVASVVMEGFRRADEWRVLERTIGNFEAVLLRDHQALATLDLATLPARERAVLDAVDGERTVRAIVEVSHLSSFEACRILVQFLEARALRRRVA